MHRSRCAPRPARARRSLLLAGLVLAALGTIASSAMPGALGQGVQANPYVQLVDVREYAGAGFGGETAHSVRLDFQVSSSGGSTTGSTTGTQTTGTSTTGTQTTAGSGTTGTMTPDALAPRAQAARAPALPKAFRMRPRAWLLRRGERPGAGEGILPRPSASDLLDPTAAAFAASRPQPRGGTIQPQPTAGSTSTTGTNPTSGTSSTTGTNPTTGTSASTGGTTGGGGTWSTSYANYYFGVDAAYFASLTVGGQHPAGDWTGAYGIAAYSVNRGSHFEYRLPGATSRNVYYVIDSGGSSGHYDGAGNPVTDASYHYNDVYSTTIGLSRRNTPTVSIDSRKVYGQPDRDGELPGDPNADLRNPSFAGWFYKGGLFVGNAPFSANDQSGTARIQAYVPAATFTYPLASSYTLLALGRPSKFPSAFPYAAYLPSPSDPNLASSPATVTWANGWDLTTATALGAGDDLSASGFPAGGSEYSRCFFPGNVANVLVAMQNEAAVVSGGGGYWQYFSSPTYEAQFATTFPLSDSQPRTWTADRTAYASTHYVLP